VLQLFSPEDIFKSPPKFQPGLELFLPNGVMNDWAVRLASIPDFLFE
jgi:hypothetical protein